MTDVMTWSDGMLHVCHVAILLAFLLQGLVDACGRTPAKPRSTPAPTTVQVETTTEVESHRKVCTPEEENTQGCLNGGTCFALLLGNRTLSCSCPQWYWGHRCQELSPDIFGEVHEEDKVLTASIAAGVSVLVILLTMGIIYAVVRVKRKRNRQATGLNGIRKNGTLLTRFDSPDEMEDSITEEDKKFKPLINNHHLLNDIQNCNRETKV